MAEGGLQSVINLLVKTDTEGESKLDRLKKKLENLGSGAQDGAEEATGFMDSFRDALGMAGDEAEETESSFMKLTGQGLALLFAGRFLSQTFGGLSRSMRDMVGISDMVSGTLTSVLAPTFAKLAEPVSRITSWFMDLDEGTKTLIASFVAIAATIAPIIMVFGQLVAMAAAFGVTTVALVSGIAGVIAIAMILGAALIYLEKRFGAVSILIEAFGRIFRGVASIFSDIVNGEWSNAADTLISAVSNAVSATKDILKGLGSSLISLLSDAASRAVSGGKDIAEGIINGITSFLKDNSDKVLNALDTLIPGVPIQSLIGAGSSAFSAISSGMSRVNDFVITDSGRMLKTHPNDTIIGTKNPDSLGGGNGNTVNIRVDNPTVRDDRDIDKIAREIEKRMDRNTRGRGLTR